ncbi:MAG: HAD family hydrolase [Candidatus Uhrbacteria bacterium]
MDENIQGVNGSKIRLFLFDWSGTISDDRRPVFEANRRMRAGYGIPSVSFDEWLGSIRGNAYDAFLALGITVTERELNENYLACLSGVVADGIRPEAYLDAADAIARLSELGRPIGVVSSHPQSHLSNEAERYGIHGRFDVISGDHRDKTPELVRLCAQYGVDPSNACYVGDMTFDVQAAKRAGMKSIAVTTGYHPRALLEAENPDALFDSLTELVATTTPDPLLPMRRGNVG